MKQIRLLFNVKFCGLANGSSLALSGMWNNFSEEINVLSLESRKLVAL